MTHQDTSRGSSSLSLRYPPHHRILERVLDGEGWEAGSRAGGSKHWQMSEEGRVFQRVAWPYALFFQGNRDESTNVDMTLVQRDVQVSLVAVEVPVWAS